MLQMNVRGVMLLIVVASAQDDAFDRVVPESRGPARVTAQTSALKTGEFTEVGSTTFVKSKMKLAEKPAATPATPAAPAVTKPAAPAVTKATKKPAAPATKKPAAPATKKPAAPATKKPAAPATKKPSKLAAKAAAAAKKMSGWNGRAAAYLAKKLSPPAKPAAPAGKKPAAPAVKKPAAPAGKKPAAPAGKKPAAPAVKKPAAPAAKPAAPPAKKPAVPPAKKKKAVAPGGTPDIWAHNNGHGPGGWKIVGAKNLEKYAKTEGGTKAALAAKPSGGK